MAIKKLKYGQNEVIVDYADKDSAGNKITTTYGTKTYVDTQDTALSDRIDALEGRGRFLSGWNVETGKPTSYPVVPSGATYPYTYTYKAGDYYIIANVNASGTKYKPDGSSITKASASASWTIGTATESSSEIYVNDYYVYDGDSWELIHNTSKEAVWGKITGTLSNQSDLQTALNGKQNTLTFDSIPTASSTNPCTSGGIKTYVDNNGGKINVIQLNGTSLPISNKTVNVDGVVLTSGNQTIAGIKTFNNKIVCGDTITGRNLWSEGTVAVGQNNFNYTDYEHGSIHFIDDEDNVDYRYYFPSADGTLALTSDITAANAGFVITDYTLES